VAAQAHRRFARLVDLLFVCASRLPEAGITSVLIHAAVSAARAAGAPAIEAYPLDAKLKSKRDRHGYASTFARAGFKVVGCHTPARPIMRRDLRKRSEVAAPGKSRPKKAIKTRP